jgi:hypothetical protein
VATAADLGGVMSDYERECAKYYDEIDTLAAQYVRDGYAPVQARSMATDVVQTRRREAARTRNNPDTLRRLAALGGLD